MKVLKFGGSSVGSSKSILNVIDILNNNDNQKKIVVLSAFQGTTDTLHNCALLASVSDIAYQDYLNSLEEKPPSYSQISSIR